MAEISNNKSKNTNTFRFKSFADRVTEIDIRSLALYHIGHENEELPEDNETYFHQTLKKWMVLNLSDEYSYFSRKCLKIVTLPQLIHKKDFVIDLLLERLSHATNLSLQPLLELLYVLARDLREEFYPHFQRVLDRLICLLNAQDAEQLEWTLVCLAYLFKTLKPHLKKHIGVVFHAILPLLDENRYADHVTNFAVECFSFIARDIRDYSRFLDFILETVAREQVESVQGCGRLLFEIMRGTKGLFHSSAGDFLQFIFEALLDTKRKSAEKTTLLGEIVHHAVAQLLGFIYPQSMTLFWQRLCTVTQSRTPEAPILNLIAVFLQVAEHQEGRFLSEMQLLVPTILKMLDNCSQKESEQLEALKLLILLVSKILLSSATLLTQLDTSRMLRKVLALPQRDIYEEFLLLITAHTQFELLILPSLVAYFERYMDLRSYELVARIINSKKPLFEGSNWQPYNLDIKHSETLRKITSEMSEFNIVLTSEKLEQHLLILIIAPHITALDKKPLAPILSKETLKLIQNLEKESQDAPKNNLEKYLIIFSLLVDTQLNLKFKFSKDMLQRAILALLPHTARLRALYCLQKLLCQSAAGALNLHKNTQISESLAPLLASHSHDVRLAAAHCLQSLFGGGKNSTEESLTTPYAIFYSAAGIEPTVHNYREQLLQLQRLEPAGELFKSFTNDVYKVDTLRFLLGMLYYNFKLIWEPVLKLIEQYARVLSTQQFWPIYYEQLQLTAVRLDKELANQVQDSSATNIGKSELTAQETVDFSDGFPEELWLNSTLAELLPATEITTLSQQELLNYRNLLWMRLPNFGQLAELKNRDLVTLFLKFINDEYRKQLETRELTWDLSAEGIISPEVAEFEDEEENSDAEQNENDENVQKIKFNTSKSNKRSTSRGRRGKISTGGTNVKSLLQTLQSQLSIFVGQPNPKALYREPELYAFYMDLLAGPNAQLQKIALDCVMAYKAKALTANKDSLYAIIDEARFRDELINFKLDTLPADYRTDFMHILLRLLYGKMITKGTQRAVGSQVRKGLILRFLGQCTTAEILWFLQMAFGKYAKYTDITASVETIPAMVKSDFDLHAVWSPKKLTSIVNLLELIRKEFGGLMDAEFQIYMLKLLTFVGAVCNQVLQTTAPLHSKMPAVFRNVKQAALQSLVNFFAHIEEFAWQPEQIQCLTDVFVWPAVAKLPQESIHTPTALLKLLLQWGERPKHFAYLNQRHATEENTIFSYVVDLLLNEKAKPAVRRPILATIERLLVAANDTNLPELSKLSLDVIKPFIPQLLKRLKMNFSTRKSKQALDKRDLNILALLTTHVTEPETCDSLLQLLLPILIAKSQSAASEEVVCQVITTLSNLIKRLEVPELYILKVAPLFEQVAEVSARKMLCQLITDIAKKRHLDSKSKADVEKDISTSLRDTARLVLMLNAWDKRWVEQPDYDKRLDALKEITQRLESQNVDMQLGVLVIYNCFYTLRFDKDMGLRDNAAEHLRVLVPGLAKRYAQDRKQLDYLFGDVLLNLLRRVVRDSNDNVRNEGIRLLGAMARQCTPEMHELLADLAPLADSTDMEVDFFENLTHLQSHRHGRALLKFCAHAETLTTAPSPRTLTQFILPLASRYLLQEKHAGKHTLVDAAIETVGIVCQLLPWQHYHTILRYYLMKMRTAQEHQRQCVRIVVRILDSFHYDLSSSKADAQALEQLKSELSKEKPPEDDAEKENASKTTQKVDKVTANDEEDDEHDGEKTMDKEDDENLDDALAKADSEELESAENKPNLEPILKKSMLLTANASKRVMSTIATILIPTLNRSITEQSSYDNKHKVNRKRFSQEREEEEILRVPIALALVKLMQKLPKELLDTSLPGVFMKVCTFLRSPLKSVRMLTRDILRKIMLTLGASYLALLLDHLQTLLTRGFQVHVLAVTVHGVLDALREQLQPGDIETCLSNLLEVALNDIFGEITAEKQIEKIAAHTPEAKPSAKSYLVLHIAARNIQETCLLDLLMPFKEHLARTHSRKVTLKIQECFGKIVGGLVENVHISRESLLIFIYGTMSESIVDLLPGTQRRALSEQEREKMRRARPDCYLIQAAPKRSSGPAINKLAKSNAQANAHILIEFGLEMLHIVLKRKKLAELDYQPFLNPILPLLRDALQSTHARVTTFALKCFAAIWNDAYELPALQEYLDAVVRRLFEILKNFSTFGASRQEDNLQLVKSVFKAIVALLRKCTEYKLTVDQIDQLVLHIEQELHDASENQTLSFSLLKAMIARRVDTPQVHDIMKRIGDLSIVSQSDFVRDEARAMLVTYVMEYKLKRRVDQIVKFFAVQLCYSLPNGRQSAIKFLLLIIRKFPLDVLSQRAEFLYLSLGARLVNDEDPDCRRAVAECIELLIQRLERVDRQRLFDMTLLFFDASHKPSVREMAAALCSRFLVAEKQAFGARLKLVLPVIVARLSLNNPSAPGRFVKAPVSLGIDVDRTDVSAKKSKKQKNLPVVDMLADEEETEEAVARKQRSIDHEIIQMQYCLLKMFEHCAADMFSTSDELTHTVDELAYESQKLLAHEHTWVRCNAAKIIAQILASYDFALVGRKLSKLPEDTEVSNGTTLSKLDFIYLNPEYDIKSLVLDMCAQMIPGDTPQTMIDEIVKIFLYVANMLRDVPFVVRKDTVDSEVQETAVTRINLNWLVRNIRFLINKEVAKASHCISMRSALFTLIEGLITLLSIESLEKLAPSLLAALVREMSEDDQNVDTELRQQALRVGSRLRKRIGSDIYDKLRTSTQTKLMMRRAERKKVIAQEKINDPLRAAKRKVGAQERKKQSKRRKTDVIRGKAADVKQKLKKRKRKAGEDDDLF